MLKTVEWGELVDEDGTYGDPSHGPKFGSPAGSSFGNPAPSPQRLGLPADFSLCAENHCPWAGSLGDDGQHDPGWRTRRRRNRHPIYCDYSSQSFGSSFLVEECSGMKQNVGIRLLTKKNTPPYPGNGGVHHCICAPGEIRTHNQQLRRIWVAVNILSTGNNTSNMSNVSA